MALPGRRGAALLVIAALLTIVACAPASSSKARTATFVTPVRTAVSITSRDDHRPVWPGGGPEVEARQFTSAALGRAMPYLVYLPPDYDTGTERYPVVYLLHGMGGSDDEWRGYGMLEMADRMIRAGQIAPLIIVLPQGDQSYWVDHATGAREKWGAYVAHDVVADVDARLRTLADGAHRAIGGISMGAHGAMQLALNYPGTFRVVGAHSLVLRRFGSAPDFFGDRNEYAKRDPMQLIAAKTETARALALWIDIGDRDQWASLASEFEGKLTGLGIGHQWHQWPGDHSASYWSAHLRDYLRFYDSALAVKAAP